MPAAGGQSQMMNLQLPVRPYQILPIWNSISSNWLRVIVSFTLINEVDFLMQQQYKAKKGFLPRIRLFFFHEIMLYTLK